MLCMEKKREKSIEKGTPQFMLMRKKGLKEKTKKNVKKDL